MGIVSSIKKIISSKKKSNAAPSGSSSRIIPNPSSPTGYVDTRGQPVSVAPSSPQATIGQAFPQRETAITKGLVRSGGGGGSSGSSSAPSQSTIPQTAQTAQTTQKPTTAPTTKPTGSVKDLSKMENAFTMSALGQEFMQPYLRERQVSYDSSLGVPITQVERVEPEIVNMHFGEVYKESPRKASQEEIDFFYSQGKTLIASTEPRTYRQKAKEDIMGVVSAFQQPKEISSSGFTGVKTLTGVDLTSPKLGEYFVTGSIAVASFGTIRRPDTKAAQLVGGVYSGNIIDIKEHPIRNAVIIGAGLGVGALAKTATIGAKAVSPSLGIVTKGGIMGGGAALLGYEGIKTTGKVMAAPSYTEKGAIIGVAVKDVALFGYGAAKGGQLVTQARGWYATRGRTFLETKQDIFPSAPASQHLDLFRKNIIPELGNKPGAFHVTPDRFYGDMLTPKAGTSELPGVYGSTQVSITFSQIGGGKYKLIPSVKDMFDIEGKPGVAFLQPEGFRYSPFDWVREPTFEGQKSVRGKYGRFIQPARPGYMDIPGMKTEIEAIARPESGSYDFVSGDYYTRIKDVRVRVDVFRPTRTLTKTGSSSMDYAFELRGGYDSYSLPKSSAIFSPIFGYAALYRGPASSGLSSKSMASSYLPTSYRAGSSSMISSYINTPSSYRPYSSSPGSSYMGSPLKLPLSSYAPSSTSSLSLIFGPSRTTPKSPPLSFPGLGAPTGKRKQVYKGRKYKYTPSIGAMGLGLKSSKVFGAETGLFTRFMVSKPKRKR